MKRSILSITMALVGLLVAAVPASADNVKYEASITENKNQVNFRVNNYFFVARDGAKASFYKDDAETPYMQEEVSYFEEALYVSFQTPKEDGTYRVVVPESEYYLCKPNTTTELQGVTCGDLEYSFVIEGSGTEVEVVTPKQSFDADTRVFSLLLDGYNFNLKGSVYVYDSESDEVYLEIDHDSEFWNGGPGYLDIDLSSITETGSYMLEIPPTSVVVTNIATRKDVTFRVVYYDFVVDGTPAKPKPFEELVTFNPADNQEIIELQSLYMTMDNSCRITSVDKSKGVNVMRDGEVVVENYTLGYIFNLGFNPRTIQITFADPEDDEAMGYVEPGEYTVVIPAGLFEFKDKSVDRTSEEITLHYTVIGRSTEPFEYTLTPAPGEVSELSTIVLTANKKLTLNSEFDFLKTTTRDDIIFRPKLSEDGKTVTMTLDEPITETGAYLLKIPDFGWLRCADGSMFGSSIVETYVIPGEWPYDVTPAPGSELESIDKVVVKFPDFKSVEATDKFSAELTNGKESYALTVSGTNTQWDLYASVTLKPERPVSSDGTWKLRIAAGSLNLVYFTAEVASPAIEAEYELKGGFAVVVSPSTGSVIADLNGFALEIDNATSVTIDDTKEVKLASMYVAAGSYHTLASTTCALNYSEADSSVSIVPAEPLEMLETYEDAQVQYVLSIPEGAIVVNGQPWVGGTFAYTYSALLAFVPEFMFNPEPGSEVAELETITVTCVNNDEGKYVIRALKDDVEVLVNGNASEITGHVSGNLRRTITFTPAIAEEGVYTIVLNGLFQVEGQEQPVALNDISYTVTGGNSVAEVLGSEGRADVYTPGGICVLKDATAENMKSLPKGIYVVKGRKIAVKH